MSIEIAGRRVLFKIVDQSRGEGRIVSFFPERRYRLVGEVISFINFKEVKGTNRLRDAPFSLSRDKVKDIQNLGNYKKIYILFFF